jgi:hypothetical protein
MVSILLSKRHMKMTSNLTLITLLTLGTSLGVIGCASMSNPIETGRDIASTGPTVLNAKSNPATIQLNQNLQPTQAAEITADVKDFNHKISEVKLKFIHVPVEVQMQNLGGTTWRATLSAEQLQMLAVTGKTVKYEANIVANNDKGQTGITQSPLNISIKAPELRTGRSS